MGNLVDLIKADVRYQDSLKACMNCGICTAICPAAEFFEYDPRRICDMVQRGDEDVIENMIVQKIIVYMDMQMVNIMVNILGVGQLIYMNVKDQMALVQDVIAIKKMLMVEDIETVICSHGNV